MRVEFEIRKGVPLPMKGSAVKGGGMKGALDSLDVGDMLRRKTGEAVTTDQIKKLEWSCRTATQKLRPKKFAIRKIEGGIGIWRVK